MKTTTGDDVKGLDMRSQQARPLASSLRPARTTRQEVRLRIRKTGNADSLMVSKRPTQNKAEQRKPKKGVTGSQSAAGGS